MPAEEPNFLAHAFKSQYNLIGLGTALGFAVLSGTLLPIIVAAGVEMIVLPLVSGNPRFQRLVRARTSQDAEEQDQARQRMEASEMLQFMPEVERQRYRGLQALTNEIRQNYKGMDSSSQMLLEQLVEKLDFLLNFYLRMRYSLTRYQNYFNSTSPERIQERIAMLEHEMQSGPERVQQIKARTKAVLAKRLERFQKAVENRDLIDAQTETVQEVLQLLRDQSYSMRDPRTITEQLDGLVSSAEETERGVKDMEDILAVEHDLLSPGGLEADIEAELQSARPAANASAAPPAGPLRARVPPPVGSPPPPPRKKVTH
jgi:hypothetical protein